MVQGASRKSSLLAALTQKSFDPVFTLYVYLLVILPSGSLFGVNVKILCFLWLVPPALFWYLHNRRTTTKHVALLLAVPTCLALWVLLGQVYLVDLPMTVAEYKDIWTTVASCWLANVFCRDDEGRCLRFLRMIFYSESLVSALKLGLLAYCFGRGISVAAVVEALDAFFKVDLMTMDFEGALGRVQFTADGLIPVCLYLLLRYRKRLGISLASALVLFLVLSLSLIFTFSRYYWAFGAAAVVLGLLFGKKDRFHAWLLGLMGAATLAALPALVNLYTLRTSAAVAGDSDSVRTVQLPALQQYFLDAPLLGHGLGSHPSDVIRNLTYTYLYEVQLYALAGQIGLVGLALLGGLAVVYFLPLWPRSWESLGRKANLLILLGLWLLAGLFNPLLLNSAAAMSYAAFRALAFVNERESPLLEGPVAKRGAVRGAAWQLPAAKRV